MQNYSFKNILNGIQLIHLQKKNDSLGQFKYFLCKTLWWSNVSHCAADAKPNGTPTTYIFLRFGRIILLHS